MTPVLLALLEDALKYDVVKIKIPAKIHIVDSEKSMYPYDVSQHLKPEQCTRIVVKESADGIEFSLRLAHLFVLYLFISLSHCLKLPSEPPYDPQPPTPTFALVNATKQQY